MNSSKLKSQKSNSKPETGSPGSSLSDQLPTVSSSELTEDECATQLRAVLHNDGQPLPAKNVSSAWTSYLEFVMEPAGWTGVLIPSQDTAELLQVEHGKKGALLVQVNEVEFENLEAEVELLHDSWANKIITVPLDEIFPTKDQEYEGLNMTSTVVALDLLRFFYKHIWMPWDEDSECSDWPTQHLDNRLHLHFSLVNGTGDQATAIRLDELMARAELNRTALLELEDLADEAEESMAGDNNGDQSMSYQMIGRMYELHQEKENIRREAEMLEDPTLRMAVISKTSSARHQQRTASSPNPGILLVWTGGHMSQLTKIVETLETEFGDKSQVTVYPELQHAIDCSVANDVIIITSPGVHEIRSLGGLCQGGQVLTRCVAGASVIISPGDMSPVFCSVNQGTLEISDLVLDCKHVNIGVMVTHGQLVLRNLVIKSAATGIMVGDRGNANLSKCKVMSAGVGVEVSSKGTASFENCQIEKCRIGVSVGDGARISVRGCNIGKNSEYGFVIHCAKKHECEGVWSGDQSISKAAQSGVDIQGSDVSRNCLGDVAVMELEKHFLNSPGMERKSQLTRRFSTPMSGKCVTPRGSNDNSPILPSLSRVLTYPE